MDLDQGSDLHASFPILHFEAVDLATATSFLKSVVPKHLTDGTLDLVGH